MQYQYERAQIADEAFNVYADTGLTPRQLAEQRAELLAACKLVWNKVLTEYHSPDSYVRQQVEAAIANAERQP